jgi:hypothetical protein
MTNIESIHENAWLSLRAVREPEQGVSGYFFSHENSCQGRKVAVLPYKRTDTGIMFLVKSEVTPCWSMEPVKSAVTGGYEGVNILEDAIREMEEETGYVITEAMLESLGTCYASKSADTIYDLFAVNVSDIIPGEMLGDGTRLESEAKCYWMKLSEASTIQDAQFCTMLLRWIFLPA